MAAAAASAPAPAASEPAGKPLQGAMKLAKGAVELDAGDRPREAYVEYLKSIHYISQVLLEEATAVEADGSDVTPDTPKMLKVAEQCLERAKSSVAKLAKAKTKLVAERILGPAPASRHRRVFSDEGGKLLPFLPPEMFQKLQTTEVQSTKKELSPLEEASLQNQKLKAAYEARLARLNPNQAMQKTSLTLSLQRQMMENLVIAKAREETLQRKMEERRLRLQEAANRRFSSNAVLTPEEQEQRAIYAAILEYEQDHEWPRLWKSQLKRKPSDLSQVPELISHLLSFADHPICQLLKKLQCSVYSRLYPLISRSAADVRVSGKVSRGLSLSSSLEAEAILSPAPDGRRRLRPSQSLHAMFSVQENNQLNLRRSLSTTPFIEDQSVDGRPTGREKDEQLPPSPAERESSFEDLEQFLSASETWPGRPAREAPARRKASQQEHLKAVVKDIHNAIDRLLSLTLLAFEGLNTAAAKDQCVARLEEAFFAPLWAPLLAVYRNVYKAREAALAKCMGLHRNMPAPEIGISSKLLPQGSLPRGTGSYPYCAAVEVLTLIPLGTCPQKKLECIVRTLRIICECAEEYCGGSEGRPQTAASAIGADDLLPILSYVVLKSNLPQLVSECAALEEFIHEGYLIGEEGYCLTSLQSALSYVESLHRPVLEKELKAPSSSGRPED